MSSIVIGSATTAVLDTGTSCVISAQWGYNPNTQRLYCIGEWVADSSRIFHKPTETLNLTVYSPGPEHVVEPTLSCGDANTIFASVSPVVCDVTGSVSYTGYSGDWLVTGYSYSKDDAGGPGQESWSLTRWKNLTTEEPAIGTSTYPTFIMRGICDGSGTDNAGILFVDGTTVTSETGSVSAGSFGKLDITINGQVSQVGGGSSAAGETGTGSANIPYTQLYI